mgnify:CR=1 FL=1
MCCLVYQRHCVAGAGRRSRTVCIFSCVFDVVGLMFWVVNRDSSMGDGRDRCFILLVKLFFSGYKPSSLFEPQIGFLTLYPAGIAIPYPSYALAGSSAYI